MSLRRVVVMLASVAVVGVVSYCYDRAFLPKEKNVVTTNQTASNEPESANEDDATDTLQRVAPQLLQLFPDENDWRRNAANVVFPPGRECVFLFRGAPSLSADGKTVSLNACTLVLLAKASDRISEDERFRRAIVLESTDKLELTFAQSFASLSAIEEGRIDFTSFEYGKMSGAVVIRSQMNSPGVEDDLYFKTREVVFNMTQIHTNFEVSFYFGRNGGSGKGLTIDLDVPLRFSSNRLRDELDPNEKAAPKVEKNEDPLECAERIAEDGNLGAGFSIKGVQLNELSGFVRFYYNDDVIKKSKNDALDGETTTEEQASNDEKEEEEDNKDEYVDVRGKKGLYFSSNPNVVGGWCVRFNRDVELIAYDKEGMKAQLLCDSLYLYLRDKELDELWKNSQEARSVLERRKVTGVLTNLEATTVRAIGNATNRAIVKFPEDAQEISADEFMYDLQTNRLDLRSATPDEAVCISRNSESQFVDVRSQMIQVQLSDEKKFQRVYAGKSGVLNTLVNDESQIGRNLSVTWEDGLQIVPTEERPDVLQLTSSGAVSFSLEEVGTFAATEANLWCKMESDPNEADPNDDQSKKQEKNVPFDASKKATFTPICADFRKNVVFQGPRGTAKIADSVVVRFGKANGAAIDSEENDADKKDAKSIFAESQKDDDPSSRFEISGQKLELNCVLREKDGKRMHVDVDKIAILGGVSFVDRLNLDGSEKMSLVAEKARIGKPGESQMRIELEGAPNRPATFKTKELALSGERVAVDCAANQFQVVGDGNLELEPTKSLKAQNVASNATENNTLSAAPDNSLNNAADASRESYADFLSDEKIAVAWSDSMVFDGQTLSFKAIEGDDVKITQGVQKILCPEARLTLKKPVSLFDLNFNKASEKPDVEYVQCFGSLERPVRVEMESRRETEPNTYYQASFQNLKYQHSTGEFLVKNGGEFRAVAYAKQDPFQTLGVSNAQKEEPDDPTDVKKPCWVCTHMKFQGDLQGDAARREMTATNGIRAVMAATYDPNIKLDVDQRETFPQDFATVSGREAHIKIVLDDAKDKTNKKNTAKDLIDKLELETRGNVVFRQKDLVGLCDSLRYVSQKDLVILSGSETQKASLFRQSGDGAQRKLLGEFMRALFKLDTQTLDIESFTKIDE